MLCLGVSTQEIEEVSIRLFPDSCDFCQRVKVCKKAGDNCGRPECVQGWRLKHLKPLIVHNLSPKN